MLAWDTLARNNLKPVHWEGYALGAQGSFTLYAKNPQQTQKLLDACMREIQRLEMLFSLYDDRSELCQLNAQGFLKNPSPEWIQLCNTIDQAHTMTSGYFDPTIQPLWKLYAKHVSKTSDKAPPTQADITSTLKSTGWHNVHVSNREIRFSQDKMQLTLNGIAQGFITEHIASLLKENGFEHVMVELGEKQVIGEHPKNRPWRIGIQEADKPAKIHSIAELRNQALATSSAYGTSFSQKIHHLINPKTGHTQSPWKSLSVIAPSATLADALSTGLSFAQANTLKHIEQTHPDIQIITQ